MIRDSNHRRVGIFISTISILLTFFSAPLINSAIAQEKGDAEVPDRNRGRELWPLFSYKNQAGEQKLQVLWPIYESRRDKDKSSFSLRPFFSQENRYDERAQSWSLLWPLIESSKDGARRHARALPFYWNTQSAEESRSLLAPFYYSYRNDPEDRSHAFIAPNIYYQSHGTSRSWHVFPFVGYGSDGARKRFWSALYPLFKGEKDEALGKLEYDIFWPFGGYRKDNFLGSYSWSPLHYAANGADQSS